VFRRPLSRLASRTRWAPKSTAQKHPPNDVPRQCPMSHGPQSSTEAEKDKCRNALSGCHAALKCANWKQ
jgi:hypothetical protein